MTDRRAHWDDDLIGSVIGEIGALRPSPHSLRDTAYAVIAAVEDWMDANDNPLPHVLNECLQWLDAERAAIQRVREVHRPSWSTIWSHDLQQAITVTTCRCGSEQYPCPTIEALEGDKR